MPNVLILGHSFVHRLRCDLLSNFDPRTELDFGLLGSVNVHLFGVGGRSVSSLRKHDLHVVSRIAPEAIILEIGNELSQLGLRLLAPRLKI